MVQWTESDFEGDTSNFWEDIAKKIQRLYAIEYPNDRKVTKKHYEELTLKMGGIMPFENIRREYSWD